MGGTLSRNSDYKNEYQSVVKGIEDKCKLRSEHKKLLKESVQLPCGIAELPENAEKNRGSIKNFDFYTVTLPEKNRGNFINASWVDGYKAPGKFILCQAPLRENIQNWWAMIFTYKIRVIVMLTRIVEKDREACFPYWSQVPHTSVSFGKFYIETKKIQVFQDHVITSLHVMNGNRASLDVKHFAYTDWPSRKVPQNPSGFYSFFVKVRKAQSKAEFYQSGILPMLVHSSAGLNRAAAFVTIDICMTQYCESKTIDLVSVVRSLRKQRRDCLSLSEQYIFCHNIVSWYGR